MALGLLRTCVLFTWACGHHLLRSHSGTCTVLGSLHPSILIFLTNPQDWYYSSFRAKQTEILRGSASGPKAAARDERTINLHGIHSAPAVGHTSGQLLLLPWALPPKGAGVQFCCVGGAEPIDSAKSPRYLRSRGHRASTFLNLCGPVGNGSWNPFSGRCSLAGPSNLSCQPRHDACLKHTWTLSSYFIP